MSRQANRRVLVLIVVFVVLDFIPHFGPPRFRYTGSDPAVPVWNIGWPLTVAIYDARFGWQFGGPGIVMVPALQFLLVLAWAFVETLAAGLARLRGNPEGNRGGADFHPATTASLVTWHFLAVGASSPLLSGLLRSAAAGDSLMLGFMVSVVVKPAIFGAVPSRSPTLRCIPASGSAVMGSTVGLIDAGLSIGLGRAFLDLAPSNVAPLATSACLVAMIFAPTLAACIMAIFWLAEKRRPSHGTIDEPAPDVPA